MPQGLKNSGWRPWNSWAERVFSTLTSVIPSPFILLKPILFRVISPSIVQFSPCCRPLSWLYSDLSTQGKWNKKLGFRALNAAIQPNMTSATMNSTTLNGLQLGSIAQSVCYSLANQIMLHKVCTVRWPIGFCFSKCAPYYDHSDLVARVQVLGSMNVAQLFCLADCGMYQYPPCSI